jgi:hypothetical protein
MKDALRLREETVEPVFSAFSCRLHEEITAL